jgi:hypothetical protein
MEHGPVTRAWGIPETTITLLRGGTCAGLADTVAPPAEVRTVKIPRQWIDCGRLLETATTTLGMPLRFVLPTTVIETLDLDAEGRKATKLMIKSPAIRTRMMCCLRISMSS